MDIARAHQRMQKALIFFKEELSKIRGNRIDPRLIEDLLIEVYETRVPIKQVGTVSVVDPTLLTVQCWDKNNVVGVQKVIEVSNLNVTLSAEGNLVRVSFPSLTEDRRQELVKIVKQLVEDAKIAMRRIRRDFLDSLSIAGVSEDEVARGKKEMQKLTDEFNTTVGQEFERKEKELLTI